MIFSLYNKTTLSKKQYWIIQFYAACFLMSLWLIGAVFGAFSFEYSTKVSIIVRGTLDVYALIVILICRNVVVEKKRTIYSFYIFLMIVYTLRLLYDMFFGPYLTVLPSSVLFNDFILIVLGIFFPALALIECGKFLDFKPIAKCVFWMGFIIILLSRDIMSTSIGLDAYQYGRISAGNTLHTLSLVRIGVFEVIAAVHLLLNGNNRIFLKIVYFVGIGLGLWLSLASGSRGGLVALVIAFGIYGAFSSRKNFTAITIAIVLLVLFLINIVSILNWLSNYFPVIGERMLIFVLYNDQSGRENYRELAYRFILENPILGYSYRVNSDLTGYTTHNGIIDVALALGIPMAIVFVYFFYIKSFVMSYKMMIEKKYFFPTVMAVFSMVASMSGSSITDGGWHFSMCILFSAYYYHYLHDKKQKIINQL